MNARMAQEAMAAITDPAVTAEDGWCSRFVRQVTEKVYGTKFAHLFRSDAILTAYAFRDAQLAAVPQWRAVQPGDILFQTSGHGSHGHVAIYVGSGLVAENSSTSIGRVQGAKGFRSLKQFGEYQLVGRLPSAE